LLCALSSRVRTVWAKEGPENAMKATAKINDAISRI
jgi:hypothetical protein